MIRLDNVSKFYYSKGVIATGFSRVSLDFEIGEFVAITGESGSGKSTLLNVISGLDTYEEGEMYIDGKETSHYTEKDFEAYRRKYIGNIFQSFNLVNSYTVYQNIELVLLLNGAKRKDVKSKVNSLIEQVGLKEYKHTKASKLSGGQKQRVAIARALAKDTPVIIADEPTGNLDSESAAGIIKLLSEISKDKLVIIVTHNYDQVEPYVTRKIKMHDGKVIEDLKLKDFESTETVSKATFNSIRFLPKVRLGVRNAFNIPVKFLLLTFVFLFIASAITSELSVFKHEEHENQVSGYNYYFNDTSPERIIIKKSNGTNFTSADYERLSKLSNVDKVVKNDLLCDGGISITDGKELYFYGKVNSIENANFISVDLGSMPKADDEIVLVANRDSYLFNKNSESVIGRNVCISRSYVSDENIKKDLKIVGVKFADKSDLSFFNAYDDGAVFLSSAEMEKIQYMFNMDYSQYTVTFENKVFNGENIASGGEMYVYPSPLVPKGEAYASDFLLGYVKDGKYLNKDVTITIKNIYYSDSFDCKITKTVTKYNINNLLDIPKEDFESYNDGIFVSTEDYNRLFDRSSYQSSVYVKDALQRENTVKELKDMGMTPLVVSDTNVQGGDAVVIQVLSVCVTFALAVALFFISYFVIRIILKSRNVYYSTIRMLGANVGTARDLLVIDLITDANIACLAAFGIFKYLIHTFPENYVMNSISVYMGTKEYVAIYLIVIAISLLISLRYSKKLFKKSTINTFKEEV